MSDYRTQTAKQLPAKQTQPRQRRLQPTCEGSHVDFPAFQNLSTASTRTIDFPADSNAGNIAISAAPSCSWLAVRDSLGPAPPSCIDYVTSDIRSLRIADEREPFPPSNQQSSNRAKPARGQPTL